MTLIIGLMVGKVDMNRIKKILCFCIFISSIGNAWALEDMHWFKNELNCSDVKVTVYSYCQKEENTTMNSFCSQQKITFDNANGSQIKKENLLDKEPVRRNFHVLGSMRCVFGENQKPYLYMILDNGGNCDACEIDAVMDLQGRWKRYDRKWLVSGKEKLDIKKRENDWFHKTTAFYLHNKIEVDSKP